MASPRYIGLLLCLGLSWAQVNVPTTPDAPVVVGQTFLAGGLDPTVDSTPWALTSHGISEKLFTVDKDGNIVGQVAESVSKVSENVWEVMLKPNYKFSDGTEVTAQHVATCLQELNTKNSNAQSQLGQMTVTVPGGGANPHLKVRIQSERPTHVMMAVLAEWVFVVYMKDTNGNFIFTGPYKVDTFSSSLISLTPNTHYPQASERPQLKIRKYADGHALAEGMKNQEVDIGFHLPIDRLTEMRRTAGVRVKSFEVGYHYMAFHNMNRLPDLRVRRAIDIAIDRQALSQALAGGKGTRSLFPDNSPFYSDTSDPHGDMSAAAALLDEAGWTLTNGKRVKDGQELTINLVAYPHRPGLVIMQPVIAEALTALGITVTQTLTGQDWSETQAIIDARSFDMLMWAQHTLPAGDPLWFLNTFFRSDGGKNYPGLQSSAVDTLLDTLSLREQHTARVAATVAAQTAILDEVPVSNLVTPFWHVGLSDRMRDYQPWGSDYYVIRADLFVSPPLPEVPDTSGGMRADLQWPGMLLCLFLSALMLFHLA